MYHPVGFSPLSHMFVGPKLGVFHRGKKPEFLMGKTPMGQYSCCCFFVCLFVCFFLFVVKEKERELVGALSPVNHKRLHQG